MLVSSCHSYTCAVAAGRTYGERSGAGRLQHAQQRVLQVRVVGGLAALHTERKLAGVEALLAHAVATPAAGQFSEDYQLEALMPRRMCL